MYAVLNMGYTPSQYINLSQKDRAFIIACIKIKIKEEKNAKKRAKMNANRRRARRK